MCRPAECKAIWGQSKLKWDSLNSLNWRIATISFIPDYFHNWERMRSNESWADQCCWCRKWSWRKTKLITHFNRLKLIQIWMGSSISRKMEEGIWIQPCNVGSGRHGGAAGGVVDLIASGTPELRTPELRVLRLSPTSQRHVYWLQWSAWSSAHPESISASCTMFLR